MSMPETNKRKRLEDIRVYSPSRGNLAIKSEALPYTRVAEPETAAPRRPVLVPAAPADKRRTLLDLLRERKVFAKTAAIACVFVAAAALIVTVSGYNNISAVQKQINDLNESVSRMQIDVKSAERTYLESIDTEAAQRAAADAGMVYPVRGGNGN